MPAKSLDAYETFSTACRLFNNPAGGRGTHHQRPNATARDGGDTLEEAGGHVAGAAATAAEEAGAAA